jgi:hypothetical protein
MGAIVANVRPSTQHLLPEVGRVMAKADLRNPEIDFRALAGRALALAAGALGWNLDELAQQLTTDPQHPRCPRQVSRWLSGAERLQLDVVMANDELFTEFLVRLARVRGGFDVATTLTRRIA